MTFPTKSENRSNQDSIKRLKKESKNNQYLKRNSQERSIKKKKRDNFS